jgi:hypothetical protein
MPLPMREQELVDTGAPKVFAFWKYDLFPFMLGGEGYLVEWGKVYVPSYQNTFKPIITLNKADGQKLHDELKILEHEHYAAKQQLAERFRGQRDGILKRHGQEYPK